MIDMTLMFKDRKNWLNSKWIIYTFILPKNVITQIKQIYWTKLVDFLIGHYTYRIFPPAIDIIPTLLAVVYSNGKYTN